MQDQKVLISEAADALGFFSFEPRALLTACRQLLTRRPEIGGLWWLTSVAALSEDPRAACWSVLDELGADCTVDHLVEGLANGFDTDPVVSVDSSASTLRRDLAAYVEVVSHYPHDVEEADVVVLAASAFTSGSGPTQALLSAETWQLMELATEHAKQVWLVLPLGPAMPKPYWEEIVRRSDGHRVLDCQQVNRIYGTRGTMAKTNLELPAMPVAPELLVCLD